MSFEDHDDAPPLAPKPDPRSLALDREDTLVLLIDAQEGLAARMEPAALAATLARIQTLLDGAALLGLPVVTSEQEPARLGPTLPALAALLPRPPLAKSELSLGANKALARAVLQTGRRQVLLAGFETHGAVFQTARDLALGGLFSFVAQDAVLSRRAEEVALGLRLAERAGATITSVETALLDLLATADAPEAAALFERLGK